MIEINLLRYINKSFSEIHEYAHSEVALKVGREKKRFINPIFFIYFLAVLVVSIAGYQLFQHNFYFNQLEDIFRVENIPILAGREDKIVPDGKIKEIDNTSIKEGLDEFVKIGTIKFNKIDYVGDGKQQKIDIEKKEKLTKETEAGIKNNKVSIDKELTKKSEVKNVKEKKESPVVIAPSYQVVIFNILDRNLVKLEKKLAPKNINHKVMSSRTHIRETWDLYKITPGSKKYIAGREVTFIKTFNDRYSAILYAKNNKFSTIIKKRKLKLIYYDIKVYPFDNQQLAKQFISNSKIKVEKFDILPIKD